MMIINSYLDKQIYLALYCTYSYETCERKKIIFKLLVNG
jgi:hypothetical protein